MKKALVIRHVAYEDLGTWGPVLEAHGYAIARHDAGRAALSLHDAEVADLLVMLGGPLGVYQADAYPCIDEAIRAVRARLPRDAPTLGICFGSQIVAAAAGARVYPGPHGKEIGWGPVALTDAGRRTALAALGDRLPVFHWHGDTFDLPPGAALLARTERYAQAFAVGRRTLALQFHLEVTADDLESWYIGNTLEIGQAPGLSVAQLRADAACHAGALAPAAARVLARWLADLDAS
jgi:GMP synthase (glutamine-hydrolysing)